MKDLQKLYNECLQELNNIDIEYGVIRSISINNRLTRTWGLCRTFYENGCDKVFRIDISSRLLKDDVDDIATKDTIIHEILHTCEGCQNHGKEWKKQAEKVNKEYPQYHISRTTSTTKKGISDENEYKYIIQCKTCKKKWKYRRNTNVVKKCKFLDCPICHTKTLELTTNF